MNAGKAVYGILSGTTAVTDIVGTRIFPEIAEQEAVTPFVIYQLQSVAPEDTHDGPSKLDEVRFEFLCYADSYNAAADLAVAVRGALDRVSGTYNGVNVESVQFNDVDVEIEYDPRRYSQVLKFTFRIKRDDIEIALGTPVTGAQLGDLSDVNVDGVTDNQILSYDAATDTWVPAADAGGANELSDLSDANVSLPSDGEVLIYSGGEFVNDNIAISNVTNLQSELDATPDSLDDLTDVKIIGTPSEGDALVYQSGFFSLGTAGASTLGDLTDVNTTGAGVGSLIQYNGSSWDISAAELPSDAVYYHNRYASEAETLLDGATETVELYYTAQADGDGLHEDAQTDTATTGFDIRRKLYYAEKAQADPNTSGDWTQFTAIADNTTFANAKAALLAYLKERTGGTVPISLKQTWEEVAQAPAFTGLLNESYGSGAAAAYSVRRLNGNYTGAAIQVERSSDNTTQDIGFDSNGDLDESALTTFCTGTTCKVRTWYGQEASGGTGSGNDAVQTTHANQPTIYTGGAIVKENGRVAVQGGLNIFLPHGQNPQNDAKFFGVIKVVSQSMLLGTENTGEFIYAAQSGSTSTNIAANHTINTQQKDGVTYTGTTRADIYSDFSNRALLYLDYEATLVTGSTGRFGYPTSGTWGMYQLQEAIWYPDTSTNPVASIESNIGDYFTQNTPLLDTYTGAAAAYSLRKLRTAYTGSAIRVRRASDNTEQDIGFNVFGELDTVSLASFCSGTDGFVKTWYDQSGNANDATQTTAANQPKIYDSVTGVVTENGKPMIQTASQKYLNTNVDDGVKMYTVASVDQTSMLAEWRTPDGSGAVSQGFLMAAQSGSTASFYDNTTLTVNAIRKNGSTYAFASKTRGDIYTDFFGQHLGYFDVTTARNDISLGYQYNSATFPMYNTQELIIYPSSSTHTPSNIEDNINTFYSIY